MREALDRAFDRLDAEGAPQLLADRLLAGGIAEHLANRLLEGPELERIVGLALESSGAERLLSEALDSPGAERLVALTLESPGVERMVLRAVESRVVDEAIGLVVEDAAERLRSSPAMWTLVDEIVQSPMVTDAITAQSMGFADQVGEEIRDRSRHVDATLERAAWRLLRRRRSAPGDGTPSPGAA